MNLDLKLRSLAVFVMAAGLGALSGCASVSDGRGSQSGRSYEPAPSQPASESSSVYRVTPYPAPLPGDEDQRAQGAFAKPNVNARAYADMYFEHYGVNPTIETAEASTSTFAVDVDTAAYTLARAYLADGHLPEREAIRVEEFVNAFDYGYRPPDRGARQPFAVQAEVFPSPNRPGFDVLHIGLKGKNIHPAQRKPANLVFVIDVSGSMADGGRLESVKHALHALAEQLQARDRVAIVAYSTQAWVALPSTMAASAHRIHDAIDRLTPLDSTNAAAGLELGYELARANYLDYGVNRVILCSDGVANQGVTGADGILRLIDGGRQAGVGLTAVGVGLGNYNDVLLEQLANRANGSYHYIDRAEEAERLFVSQMTGTLQVIAQNVKVQLEFDPRAVVRYRLLGYENRALESEDFRDDTVDAGEIGAGHSVTALYEVKLTEQARRTGLGFVRVRHQRPGGGQSRLFERRIKPEVIRTAFSSASAPARLSLVVAGFAEKLRGSYWVRKLNYDELLNQLERLPPASRSQDSVRELEELIRTSQQLDRRADRFESEMPIALMSFDHVPVLR